jgi:glutamyl-tRNA reductase
VTNFARNVFEQFDDKQVLVIGAGETAEETLVYLKSEGARQITIVNRSRNAAAALAEKYGGRAEAWEQLDDRLIEADLVVSTTGATEPIVTLERFKRLELRRYQRPLFVLDLAVPRDFDPAIGDCLGVYLYSLDDMQAACQRNRAERDKELPQALVIVEQETADHPPLSEIVQRRTPP